MSTNKTISHCKSGANRSQVTLPFFIIIFAFLIIFVLKRNQGEDDEIIRNFGDMVHLVYLNGRRG